MTLQLSDDQKRAMLIAADMSHPREACGIVSRTGSVVLLRNVSQRPETEWEVDPDEIVRCYQKHGAPVAVWHSHPGGTTTPSEIDYAKHVLKVPMIIVAAGEVYVYEAA